MPSALHKLDKEAASLGLPTIALFVSDQVRLIRDQTIPILPVQLEVVAPPAHHGRSPGVLGLNDIVYVVPEFNPGEYSELYPDSAEYSLRHESFAGFF